MTYKKWDIVLVPFSFTNFTTVKKRPALIISPNNYNEGPDLIIMFITSKIDKLERVGDIMIKDWQDCGLLKPSMGRMKFATIEKSIVKKRLGTLTNLDQVSIKENLKQFFNL